MWSEARKQEKKLRNLMVDHKRRAERRREFYERIKKDPSQFIQIHGRRMKIHIDPAIAAAADAPVTMMPWQGDKSNLIDRFDVRAHLDYLPEEMIQRPDQEEKEEKRSKETRDTNYERYRILVQNDFLKIPEEKFLRTINLEEQFGGKTYQAQKAKEDKKKAEKNKAAIGFIYEDSVNPLLLGGFNKSESDSDSDSDSDLDLDLTVDIMALSNDQQSGINRIGKTYYLGKDDFIKYLARDIEEAEEMKVARQKEEEKAMLSGRKSRRERRMLRAQRLIGRRFSPPSYAARETSIERKDSSSSSSDSPGTPENNGKVEFITSFGGEDSEEETKLDGKESGLSGEAKAKLKRLRRRHSSSPSSIKTNSVIGPMLPTADNISNIPRKSRNRSLSRSRHERRYRRRSRRRSGSSSNRRYRRSSSGRRSPKRRRRSNSRSRHRRQNRSPPPRRRRSPNKKSSSDSDSSSSDGNATRYRSKYRNRRRSSGSSSAETRTSPIPPSPSPPVKRYYGRVKEESSSNSERETEDNGRKESTDHDNNSPSTSNNKVVPNETFKDKIRKKMQAQIKRQFKADKKAENERKQKQEEDRLFREEEMREMALKLRQRERQKRHLNKDSGSSESSEDERRRRSTSGSPKRRSSSKEMVTPPPPGVDTNLKLVDY